MARSIWKFPLKFVMKQEVLMPQGAKLLHVGVQDNFICLWAEVDVNAVRTNRTIWTIATGEGHLPESLWTHIGTVMLNDGNSVFHIYDGI